MFFDSMIKGSASLAHVLFVTFWAGFKVHYSFCERGEFTIDFELLSSVCRTNFFGWFNIVTNCTRCLLVDTLVDLHSCRIAFILQSMIHFKDAIAVLRLFSVCPLQLTNVPDMQYWICVHEVEINDSCNVVSI